MSSFKFICEECGSDDVESLAWVNPNTNELNEYETGRDDHDYCRACQQPVSLDASLEATE